MDADIKGYFDTIPLDRLIDFVGEEVADGKVLALVRQFLTAKVMEDLELKATRHTHDQIPCHYGHTRTAGATFGGAVILACYERSIPPKDGLRHHDPRDVGETTTAERMASRGEASALTVG